MLNKYQRIRSVYATRSVTSICGLEWLLNLTSKQGFVAKQKVNILMISNNSR